MSVAVADFVVDVRSGWPVVLHWRSLFIRHWRVSFREPFLLLACWVRRRDASRSQIVCGRGLE
jgi:hypothetical protein